MHIGSIALLMLAAMQPVADALRSARAARAQHADPSSRRQAGGHHHRLVMGAADAALMQAAERGDLHELQELRSRCGFVASRAVNASVQQRWRELRSLHRSMATSLGQQPNSEWAHFCDESSSIVQQPPSLYDFLVVHASSRLEQRIEQQLRCAALSSPSKWLKEVPSPPPLLYSYCLFALTACSFMAGALSSSRIFILLLHFDGDASCGGGRAAEWNQLHRTIWRRGR